MIELNLPRATRWSLGSAGLMVPLAVAVLVRLGAAPGRGEEVEEMRLAPPILCDATRLAENCRDGLHCVAGTCKPLRRSSSGREGTACGGDLCEAGLECFHGRCVGWERLPVAPEVCRARPTRAALEHLRMSCAEARRAGAPRAGDAPITACTSKEWEHLSRDDPTFTGHIEDLPGLFTVHFPQGEPGPRGGWPPPEVFGTYLEQLAPHRATLLEARALLVIGRASPEGTAEINQELAGQRIALVERLLRAALGDAAPPIHAWARAERDALAPEKFRRLKVRAVLSWDADVTQRILDPSDLTSRSGPEWGATLATINRNVLIVPLYCDGLEFYPQPSFQGVLDPSKEIR